MKRILAYAALAVSTIGCSDAVVAQTDPNPALNTPDKLAWTLFIQVNADAKTAGTTILCSKHGQATAKHSRRIRFGRRRRRQCH